MVAGETASGGESAEQAPSGKSLLDFYQKKFDEYQKQDDKYKQKVDKHLSDLISDRHELEAEVLRRGEKISDLQKALVDLQLSCFEERERFLKASAENEELKKNEKKLHENIRQALNVTQEKDLRDKIIYVLKDPQVEIGYRIEDKDQVAGLSSPPQPETQANKYLKEQVKSLQSQLDEFFKLSKTKADIVLEDCKRALESSRERIKQDEEEIRKLRYKLQKMETELRENQPKIAKRKEKEEINGVNTGQVEPLSSRSSRGKSSGSTESVTDITSSFKEMHLTLILLSKILFKLKSILNNIQNTKVFMKTLESSQIPPSFPDYVESTDVVQLETYVRQCTRLTFDVNCMQKTLVNKYFSKQFRGTEKFAHILSDLQIVNLENTLRDLATNTAEADLLVLDLNRAKFFEHLQTARGKKGKNENEKIGFKYAAEFKKLINIYKCTSGLISKAVGLTETALTKCEVDDFVEVIDMPGTSSYADKKRSERKIIRNFSSEWVDKEELPIKAAFEVVKEKRNPKQAHCIGRNLDAREIRSKSANFASAQIQTKMDKDSRNSTPECFEQGEEPVKTASVFQKQSHKPVYVSISSEQCSKLRSQAIPTSQLREEEKDFKNSGTTGEKAITRTSEDLENLIRIYKNTISEAEDLGLGSKSELKSLSSKLKLTEELLQLEQEEEIKRFQDKSVPSKQTLSEHTVNSTSDDVIRGINRTLAKVKQVESKECLQDEEFCKRLEEKINGLAKKLKDLSEEYSMKNLQQQFSEYSSVTMNKLETLAKQTRESVSDAEAQISAYKSNVKVLSQKLKDTEELLRESVNECLSLKQKLKSEEEKREKQKVVLYTELRERMTQVSDIEELEKIVEDVVSSETLVSRDKRRPSGPYECMYCKQGSGHKLCEEKIKDLRANNRKYTTEIKLIQQELKEEKIVGRADLKQAEKALSELTAERNTLKDLVPSLEAKCSSLTDQLKVERNKTRNMERYRKLEIEGFQTDIKNLKTKIRDLEKQLMKAVLIFEQDNKDLELLKTVHSTAQRSRQAVANIKRLKAKLYELETDIKNL